MRGRNKLKKIIMNRYYIIIDSIANTQKINNIMLDSTFEAIFQQPIYLRGKMVAPGEIGQHAIPAVMAAVIYPLNKYLR